MKTIQPLEKDIQRAVCDWLRVNNYFFWRSNNIPVFGRNNAGVRTFRSLPKDTPRGLPDIIVIHEGRFIGLEIKRPGQKLRPEQEDFSKKLLEHGGYYYRVESIDDLLKILLL